jgi:outer membrane receptor protein involved in Fe transport
VRGESRSEQDSPAGAFARDLRMGGKQETAGAFILHHRRLTASTQATLGARLDHWIVADGFRRTTEPGLTATEIYFPQKSAFAFSPTGGLVSKIGAHWRIQASAQSGLLQPALSQRFGLRGQDSFILQPEAALRAERRTRGEISVEYFRGERIRFRASVFADERHDVIGSQALVTGDAAFGLNLSLPAAYEVRRWINLDRARLHGAQLSILWATRKTVRLEADFIISHSHVDRVSAAPDLEGRELAGVPQVAGRATATWQVSPQTSIRARVRVTGESYANEENTRRLHSSVVADLSWNHKLSVRTEAFLWIENIGNVRVETMRGPADLVYFDSPRTFLTGVRLIW